MTNCASQNQHASRPNDADLKEFVTLLDDFADCDNSRSVNAHAIDRATWDLSVKNPSNSEEETLREPLEIMDEMPALDAERGDSGGGQGAVVTEVEVSNRRHQTFESI